MLATALTAASKRTSNATRLMEQSWAGDDSVNVCNGSGSGFDLTSLKIWVDSRKGFDISITLKNVLRLEW